MLAHETVLRQRYSLSFLTTTLLIALTTQSSLAFSITPPTEYLPVEIYTTPTNVGIVSLYPTNVTSITRGGTTGFLQTLNQAFQDWTFNTAPSDLAGSFQIEKYLAKTVFESTPVVGGQLQLRYNYVDSDPIPDGSLHWIQRVVNNHSLTGNHGDQEDVIDIDPAGQPNPYYDHAFDATETTFNDFSRRNDPAQNHNWLAELYLVKETGVRQATIYNGIQWGWNNTAQPVPEPLTIFASGVCLGFGALLKKTVKGTGQNKTKTLQKVKD
jgi:hypothetical protein